MNPFAPPSLLSTPMLGASALSLSLSLSLCDLANMQPSFHPSRVAKMASLAVAIGERCSRAGLSLAPTEHIPQNPAIAAIAIAQVLREVLSIWVICQGSLHGSTSAKLVAETKLLIAAHLKEVQGHEYESIPGSY